MKTRLSMWGAFLLLGSVLLRGLEPPTREQIEKYRQDGTLAGRIEAAYAFGNHRLAPRLAERLQARIRSLMAGSSALIDPSEPVPATELPPGAFSCLPSKGTVRIFVMPIAFSDYPASNTEAELNDWIFGNGDSSEFPTESLSNYYLRSSYDQLNLTGEVLDWYVAPYPRSHVLESGMNTADLITEAMEYHRNHGHNFAQYDNDGDGVIDYFAVLWTGPPGAWASFWWGYFTSMGSSYTIDGKRLGAFSWQWETSYLGGKFHPRVLIHETGHALGLPDYYDYTPSTPPLGGLGGLDMMDANQGDHNCFSKFLLDWIDPQVIAAGDHAVSLRPSASSPDAVIFWPGAVTGETFYEFFMAQNRDRSRNDALMPGSGLLVWHVDARLSGNYFRYDNSSSAHKLLRLMEADGQEHIEHGYGGGETDYYVTNRLLGPTTTPSSNAYDHTKTWAYLYDVHTGSQPARCRIQIGSDAVRILTVKTTPGGTTDPPPGIYGLPTGSAAQIEALPDQGCEFQGWSGSAGGSDNPLNLVMSDDQSVTAMFRSIPLLTIMSNSGGTTTPPPGTYPYPTGSTAQVTAIPDSLHAFVQWIGSVASTDNPLSIVMNGNKTIRPVFTTGLRLSIGAGEGGTTDPAPGPHTFTLGSRVRVTAIPDQAHEFVRWTGSLTSSDNPVTLVMDGPKTLSAAFRAKPALTIEAGPGGSTDPAPGVHYCSPGSQVKVTAIPDETHEFVNWTGSLTSSDNPVSLVMDGDKTLSAVFRAKPALTVETGGGGTTDPVPGVHHYSFGSQVAVRAIPESRYEFAGWSAGASGSDNPFTLVMDGDKTVLAFFRPMPALTIQTAENGTVDPAPGVYYFPTNTRVTIRATPAAGCLFTGWTGDAQGDANPIEVALTGDRSVGARFRVIQPPAGLAGRRVTNRSLSQLEIIDELTWEANPENQGIAILAYRIYLLDEARRLLAEVPASQFSYLHRQVNGAPQAYTVVAVAAGNREGVDSRVTVR